MAGIGSRSPASSADDLLDESGDPYAIYSNFENAISDTESKLVRLNERTSVLDREIASTSLAEVTLLDPKIHLLLHEVETEGRHLDDVVAATQEMEKQLSDLAGEADKNNPTVYYKVQLEQLGLLDPRLDE